MGAAVRAASGIAIRVSSSTAIGVTSGGGVTSLFKVKLS